MKNDPDRDKHILSLERKVNILAKYFCSRLGNVLRVEMFDDFVQAAWMGAIKAVDGYDPTLGTLEAYADWRIKGEILDFMRLLDPLSRGYRRILNKDEKAIAPITVSLQLDNGMNIQIPDPHSIRPYGTINASETVLSILRRSQISDRWRKVLLEYYWNENTMKVVGERMGVGECRVSQMHKGAIEKCRAASA